MIGAYAENQETQMDEDWPTTRAGAEVMSRRCDACHNAQRRPLPHSLSDERGISFWQPRIGDPRLFRSRHLVFNLSRPENSVIILAPLAEAAGGWGLCRDPRTRESVAVFKDRDEPDYRALVAMSQAGKDRLDDIKRFDMPGFRPRGDWVREMKRFGILPRGTGPSDPIDIYETERQYWQSLWYTPPAGRGPFSLRSESTRPVPLLPQESDS
jgi:hypothetical protein